eukprot:1633854-Amphidinium_carterae.1
MKISPPCFFAALTTRVFASAAADLASSASRECSQRWKVDAGLSRFYLRLAAWDQPGNEQELGIHKERHHFYDLPATHLLLARGVSYARLPTMYEAANMPESLQRDLATLVRELGGFPERCGI